MNNGIDFGKDGIWKILFKLAPPVMAAQLIQALYNMVDSIFVGRYSEAGLTALSIIYPIQLLMIAVAVGTGVGINTLMAHYLGMGKVKEKDETAGTATLLALVMWAVFATVSFFLMPKYAGMSTKSPEIIKEVVTYGRIVSVLSIGLFLESAWTKVLQSEGNMKLPMIAQIVGAVINIILDYLLIFGIGFFPALGIAGAAVATVTGQIAAAVIVMTKGFRKSPPLSVYKKYVKKIYYLGFPNILMQSAYTFYIFGLNMILKGFSDQAVTTLGLYYKWQSFFFIPLGAMQTCIVPVISYNYGAGEHKRVRRLYQITLILSAAIMAAGTLGCLVASEPLMRLFTSTPETVEAGKVALRIICLGFVVSAISTTSSGALEGLGKGTQSLVISLCRYIVFIMLLAWVLCRQFGPVGVWNAFWATEVLSAIVSLIVYKKSV